MGILRLAGLFTRPCVRPALASQRCDFDSPSGLRPLPPIRFAVLLRSRTGRHFLWRRSAYTPHPWAKERP
jgi:hypothetical protein